MGDSNQPVQSAAPRRPPEMASWEKLQLRIHGDADAPTLVHLPGLHGDWTLLAPFRQALDRRARFIEITYPHQPDWSLNDYADAVENALDRHSIGSGWILGESFSSQVSWALLDRQRRAKHNVRFEAKGLILVGGFVRHPWSLGVRCAHAVSRRVPMGLLRVLCRLYSGAARKRFQHCAGASAEFDQFVFNRANEPDRHVITCRYQLIAANHPEVIANAATLPVYHLSGAWDPIVPWWQVRPWLRKNCPGYRSTRILWSGDHNVLLSSPEESASQILAWVRDTDRSAS